MEVFLENLHGSFWFYGNIIFSWICHLVIKFFLISCKYSIVAVPSYGPLRDQHLTRASKIPRLYLKNIVIVLSPRERIRAGVL